MSQAPQFIGLRADQLQAKRVGNFQMQEFENGG